MLNIYSPNFGAPNFIKSVLMEFKKKINTNPKIADDSSTPLSLIDRPSRQKINRQTSKLNDISYQMNLKGIYSVLHPETKENKFSSAIYGSFFKIAYLHIMKILTNKEKLNNSMLLATSSPPSLLLYTQFSRSPLVL